MCEAFVLGMVPIRCAEVLVMNTTTWGREAAQVVRDAKAGLSDSVYDREFRRIYCQCRAAGLPDGVARDAAERAAEHAWRQGRAS